MDRWGDWKAVKTAAEKVPALEERIAALEKRLERCPGAACPKCGALTLRVASSRPGLGDRMAVLRVYECTDCGFREQRQEKT